MTKAKLRELFLEYTKLEPGLLGLAKQIRRERKSATANPNFCANEVWYSKYRNEVKELVGWRRRGCGDAALATSEAHDICYEYLYDLLPGCRNCLCVRLSELIDG